MDEHICVAICITTYTFSGVYTHVRTYTCIQYTDGYVSVYVHMQTRNSLYVYTYVQMCSRAECAFAHVYTNKLSYMRGYVGSG